MVKNTKMPLLQYLRNSYFVCDHCIGTTAASDGISNEAACLHALEATDGDVESAIGLLL